MAEAFAISLIFSAFWATLVMERPICWMEVPVSSTEATNDSVVAVTSSIEAAISLIAAKVSSPPPPHRWHCP